MLLLIVPLVCQGSKKALPVNGKALILIGWGTWIRTRVDGVRDRSPTARRSPNAFAKNGLASGKAAK